MWKVKCRAETAATSTDNTKQDTHIWTYIHILPQKKKNVLQPFHIPNLNYLIGFTLAKSRWSFFAVKANESLSFTSFICNQIRHPTLNQPTPQKHKIKPKTWRINLIKLKKTKIHYLRAWFSIATRSPDTRPRAGRPYPQALQWDGPSRVPSAGASRTPSRASWPATRLPWR